MCMMGVRHSIHRLCICIEQGTQYTDSVYVLSKTLNTQTLYVYVLSKALNTQTLYMYWVRHSIHRLCICIEQDNQYTDSVYVLSKALNTQTLYMYWARHSIHRLCICIEQGTQYTDSVRICIEQGTQYTDSVYVLSKALNTQTLYMYWARHSIHVCTVQYSISCMNELNITVLSYTGLTKGTF